MKMLFTDQNKHREGNQSADDGVHLLVSSFILPSSKLMGRCSLWDSRDTVELRVLTPEVATVSSLTGGFTWLWRVECCRGSASSSTSS